LKAEFPRVVPILDLKRPNFGDKDDEIKFTQQNIKNAENDFEATLKAEFHHPKPI